MRGIAGIGEPNPINSYPVRAPRIGVFAIHRAYWVCEYEPFALKDGAPLPVDVIGSYDHTDHVRNVRRYIEKFNSRSVAEKYATWVRFLWGEWGKAQNADQ